MASFLTGSSTTLSHLAVGRNNNFNIIRILAAYGVLVSHSFPISSGPGTDEPMEALLTFSIGSVGVYTFFVISGFLVAQSFERSSSILDFTLARILRIYPALIIVLVLTVFVLGPFVAIASLADYFSEFSVYLYLPRNLSLYFLQYPLPHVFEDNIYGQPINGSLWTLVHEVACYVVLTIVGLMGVFRKWLSGIFVLAAYLCVHFLIVMFADEWSLHGKLIAFNKLTFPFFIGMLLYAFRDRIVFNHLFAIGSLLVVVFWPRDFFYIQAFCASWGYFIFYLAYIPRGPLLSYNKLGDYSYGVYIYAFPFQQLMSHLFPGSSPIENMLLATGPTILFAVLSWHLVEKRSLRARKPVANFIGNFLGTSS